MALTLLQYVNDLLTDTSVISTDLTALTAQQQQEDVNGAVAAVNEVIDDLSGLGSFPTITQEGTITLATDTREYAVASGFVKVQEDKSGDAFMVDTTNGQVITPYPGGYDMMRRQQLQPANYTGLPYYWAINPTNGKFRFDTSPTSDENALVYTYMYEAETLYLTSAPTATFPITDEALSQMLPAVIEVFSRIRRGSFDATAYQKNLAKAASKIRQIPKRRSYGPHAREQSRSAVAFTS